MYIASNEGIYEIMGKRSIFIWPGHNPEKSLLSYELSIFLYPPFLMKVVCSFIY
jgi:hypothetical protein